MFLFVNDVKTDTEIKLNDTFIKRFIGLMFKVRLIKGGICITPCNSIHMFFMFQKIDVVMTDKDNVVLYLKQDVKPYTLILPKKNVTNTYELPLKSIESYNISLGDKVSHM